MLFTQADRRPRKLERGSQPAADRHERILDTSAREQQLRHISRQIRLRSAPLSLRSPRTCKLAHRARGHRDDQERPQRHPVAAIGDRESPDRRQMEEVERRGAQHRHRHAEPQTPIRRDDHDTQQVHHSQRGNRGDLLERIHQDRANSHQQNRRHHPRRSRGPAAPQSHRIDTTLHDDQRTSDTPNHPAPADRPRAGPPTG